MFWRGGHVWKDSRGICQAGEQRPSPCARCEECRVKLGRSKHLGTGLMAAGLRARANIRTTRATGRRGDVKDEAGSRRVRERPGGVGEAKNANAPL
jgi:hypothetical protein